MSPLKAIQNLSKVLPYARPPIWTLVAVPVTILLTSSLSVLPPIFIGRIIDALTHRNFASIMQQLAWYSVAMILIGVVQVASGYASMIFREVQVCNLRLALVEKLKRVNLEKIGKLSAGQLKNRILGDVEALSTQTQYALFPTITSLLTLAATLGAMIHIDVRFAAISLLLSLLTLLPMRAAAGRMRVLQTQHSESIDALYEELQEGATIQGLSLFRNPRAAARRLNVLRNLTSRILKMSAAQSVLGQCTGLASSLLSMLGPAAILAMGAYLVIHGQVTPGAIVTALIYQSRMATPFGTLSSLQGTFVTIEVVLGRLLDVFDLPDERSGQQAFISGELAFSNVSLVRDRRTAVRDVTFTVGPREHVAIVGQSGAGKSSVASLVFRLAEPTSGQITIAGIEIADFAPDSLRSAVALVPQDPLLLDASLLENLTLLQPDARDDAIDSVVTDCALQDVIAKLPEGMQTRVGQRGFRLSGGERQRICLARALLPAPKVLILDEALSGVDLPTEAEILGRLHRRLKDHMLIAITHRISSTAKFDHMMMMQAGRIIASGTPAEIRANSSMAEAR